MAAPDSRVPWIAAFLLACLSWGRAAGGDPGAEEWFDPRWRVRLTVQVEQVHRSGFTALFVDDTGSMRRDGADFRAVDPAGKELPLRVWPRSPQGLFLVVCRCGNLGSFHLYYGNPRAARGKQWKPDRGLMLATFAHSGTGRGSAADMRALLKARGACFGRGFVRAVFHGANPFGRSDNYLSLYTGYFTVDADGSYTFATASDDASFLYVDGKLVAAWPGRHTVWKGARGRYRGTVTLKKGVHAFRYEHVEYTGDQVAAAYIRGPGDKRLDVLRFAVPEPARVTGVSTRDGSYEPFIRVREAGEIAAPPLYMVVVDLEAPAGADPCWWETGDGNRVEGRRARHVYLWEGVYPVTFHYTAGGKEKSCTVKRFIRYNGQRRDLARETDFFRLITGYDFPKMGAAAYEKVAAYAVEARKDPPAAFVEAGKRLFDAMTPAGRCLFIDLLLLRGEYGRALEYIDEALEKCTTKTDRARLLIKQGDVYFYYLKKYPEAVRSYRRVTENPFLKEWGDYRLAFIRLGDVYRERARKGDAELAMAYYTRAEDINTRAHDALKSGYYTQQVLKLMKERKYDDALRMLEEWEFNFPTEKLRGFSSLQRARINYLMGRYDEALKQALNFVRIMPSTTYLADFYMLAGAACYRKGDYPRALEYYGTVVSSCPESPKREKARRLVEIIEKKVKKERRGGR